MSIDKEPLSPILIRFQQDLQLNGLKERTQQSYVRNDPGKKGSGLICSSSSLKRDLTPLLSLQAILDQP